MKRASFALAAIVAAAALNANAALLQGVGPALGGAAIDFEGWPEGTLISNQYPGVIFGQVDGGTPMIDNDPFLFAYDASSGRSVLTGSQTGGAPFPTVAGLMITVLGGASAIEFHLGDTAPLGVYTISAFDAGNNLLQSFAVTPGNFVGFTGLSGLYRVTVDSSVENDAFAIDDVRFTAVPEPGTLALLGLGFAGLAALRRRKQ